MRYGVLAGSLALVLLGAQAGRESSAQQAIPDAPKPQVSLPDLRSVTPGVGTGSTDTPNAPIPAAPAPAAGKPELIETRTEPGSTPPAPGMSAENAATSSGESEQSSKDIITYRTRVNFVDIPFTVENSKGKPVAGLTDRDVQVFENGSPEHISYFTSDASQLSVALVIDQSMTPDEMERLNDSLGAAQDAFTQYDEVAVFTYNKSTHMVTDFTGAQSARLAQAIERSKGAGRDTPLAGSLDGPLSQTTIINNQNFDPNTASQRGSTGIMINAPREIHPLNDAILEAATALSRRPLNFQRVIYVIGDGKEYGSQAKTKQVIEYLQHNRIELDATLVGDSAVMGLGFLDRFHLPLQMRDDVLPAYWQATGGSVDREFRTGGIERSFAKIASQVRDRYVLGYYTHEPFVDGKYRNIEVRVIGHGSDLNIIAKKGYWPSAMEVTPHVAPAASAQ